MTNEQKDIGILIGRIEGLSSQIADMSRKMDSVCQHGSELARINSSRIAEHDNMFKRFIYIGGAVLLGGQAGIEILRNLMAGM